MMFDPSHTSRVFGLAPGVDFPSALIAGMRARLAGKPPHAVAQVDLIVNTRRMERRLRDIYDAGPAGLLPRIRLLTDLDGLAPRLAPPPATPPLRRRLELIQLVSRLLDTDTHLAPRSSLYGLSDSLAALFDEMQSEGVTADAITDLDVGEQSGHWERAQRFIRIAQTFLDQAESPPDPEARQRLMVTRLIAHWQDHPPMRPVILAGSTGSRGTTELLMHAVARLPQGAVVLPGFDTDMRTAVWQTLDPGDSLPPEDHPQYRFRQLMRRLNLRSGDIRPWSDMPAPSPARNRLVSLSLRPAPVTHAWLSEGPKLTDLDQATENVTLVEAPTPRIEALAIAMRLRKAVDDGQTAALITPDRMLTRQVTAALDRWNVLPDDSAGTPLQLTPPGRLLRHVAALFQRPLDAEALLTLLKHPLTHSGADRNEHQLHTQLLEEQIRRSGLPYPTARTLTDMAQGIGDKLMDGAAFLRWAEWVAATFAACDVAGEKPLPEWVGDHHDLAQRITAGATCDDPRELWNREAGREAHRVMSDLMAHADHGGEMAASDYSDLVGALLSGSEVRNPDDPHPRIMIWGTLEARVQGADLVILGGLNDGTWPEAPPPDPWLNRQMRARAGLLLPERRIGLSAHDYQQAIAAPEVWLTRAIRSDEAETVPSRWLNRLENLLNGLPQVGGPDAWTAMHARGAYWIDQTTALEATTRRDLAPRPSPQPPVAARPAALFVTDIKHLIRDPYAIYAKHILRLRPIDPLVQSPDAPMRGIILHKIMEQFVKSTLSDPTLMTRAHLLAIARSVLEGDAPWPAARVMWLARIERVADWFIAREADRQGYSHPAGFEAKGHITFEDLGFTLSCYADRIDQSDKGDALIYDYKTGTPPSRREQEHFDKQLLLEAAILEQGGFDQIGAVPVAHAAFIGLGSNPAEVSAPLDEEPPHKVLAGLHALISKYMQVSQGYTARRMVKTDAEAGNYDQLARFGEWDGTRAADARRLK